MTPRKQLVRHQPDQGLIGDCWRTSIACLLDLEPADVPHFCDGDCWGDAPRANTRARAWLLGQGLGFVEVPYQGELAEIQKHLAQVAPGVHYLLAGNSASGCGHSVVGLDDRIVWDPHPDEVGIVGPMSDGFYWITWLVPAVLLQERGARARE